MRITQWGLEVTSKATGERVASEWSTRERETQERAAALKAAGRADAALVIREIEVAEPAPQIHVHNVMQSSASADLALGTPLGFALGAPLGFGLGLLFDGSC